MKNIHGVSSTQTAVAGRCYTNERRKTPKAILYGELIAGESLGLL